MVKRSESQPVIKGGGGGDLPSPPSMPILQQSKSVPDGGDKELRSSLPPTIMEAGTVDSNRLSEEKEGLHMVAPRPSVGTSPTTPVTNKGPCESTQAFLVTDFWLSSRSCHCPWPSSSESWIGIIEFMINCTLVAW